MNYFRKMFNPAIYHGHNQQSPFFEGWYFKIVDAGQTNKFAIIPGVFLGEDGYAFIQVLDGSTGHVDFITFPLESFSADDSDFFVRIDKNTFALDRIVLNIDTKDMRIKGELTFSGIKGWPVTWTSPGVMGWYAWVPRMECYHGVLSFDHRISGEMMINDRKIDFSQGQGYIEKDWGTAFPEGYIWMQSNHFSSLNTCLTASIAMIPWLGSAFRGFIVGLWLNGKLYRFATYTGAKTSRLEVSDSQVIWFMQDRRYKLEITARRGRTGDLKGPTRQDMGMRVAESLDSELHVRLIDQSGGIIFDETGIHSGLEVAGDLEKLLLTDG